MSRLDAKADRLLAFQTLTQRRRKHDIKTCVKKVPIALFVLDLLLLEMRSLLDQPTSELGDGTTIKLPHRAALKSFINFARFRLPAV